MKTQNLLVTIITLSAFAGLGFADEPDAPTNPLNGVWSVTTITPGGGGETIDPSQPGLVIFTEGHYSMVHSLGADPRPLSAVGFNPTSEEKVAQHDTIIVNTGTYDVSGSNITIRPMIAKSPEFVGGQSVMDYQINGDLLTLTIQSVVAANGDSAADAPGTLMTLQRIE